ncbi:MAG: sulfite exporter TauE/SafE family protein [Armatimonadota bacterium]
MYFPIAEASIAVYYLIGIGFAVGICGGFMGMGGGWMLVPALYAFDIPMNIAIGTSLAQMLGHAIVSTFRHWQFGHVSVRIALVMIPAEAIGVELGAGIIELFKGNPEFLDLGLSAIYIALLLALSVFMFKDIKKRQARQREAERKARENNEEPEDMMEKRSSLARWAHSIKIWPCIRCRVAGIQSISVWLIFFSAMAIGILIGLLGIGGGVVRMPMMIYLFGCPTVVAVGTGLFAIIISGGYGAFTHALKGNVDLSIAVFLFIGAAVGAQIGSYATEYVKGGKIRGIFSFLAFIAALAMITKSFLPMFTAIPQKLASTISLILIVALTAFMSLYILYMLLTGVLEKRTTLQDKP